MRQPPSGVTGELGRWLQDLTREFNAIPRMSNFSGAFPSDITGVRGEMAVNVGSASNTSILFVHYGSRSIPDKTSWNSVA